MRVHELARELGVRVSVVLQAARDEEIRYLRSASSPVPNADADTIRAHVRRGGVAARRDTRARVPDQAGGRVTSPEQEVAAAALGLDPATTGRVDPEMVATAAALGVEFTGGRATYRQVDGQRSNRRPVTPRITDPVAQPTGMAAQIREQWHSITEAEAERLAATYAAKDVSVEAARPYWEGGLGPYDLDAISQCIRDGLAPADLALLIDGRSVVNRLRGGEPVQLLLLQLPR